MSQKYNQSDTARHRSLGRRPPLGLRAMKEAALAGIRSFVERRNARFQGR
jgi:hypothetical protein